MLDAILPAGSALGLNFTGIACLLLDLILIASLAALYVQDYAPANREWRIRLLDYGLSLVAIIVISSSLLGFLGELHATGLLTFHSVLVAGSVLRPKSKRHTCDRVLALLSAGTALIATLMHPLRRVGSLRAWKGEERPITLLFLGGIGVLLWFLGPAILAIPANHDSNTYRLARIGYWLQENRIGHFPTNDPRMNFIGFNTELVMAWICSFFRSGYPLVGLVQYALGVLMLCSTYTIGLRLGLSRLAALAAVAITLGLPPIALQFFTSQTDVFTAGCLYLAIAYYLVALRTRRRWDWGMFGLAAGLAIGAKGTVLYWGPGLGCAGLVWALQERIPVRALIAGLSLAILIILPLGTPAFVLNMLDYGKPFAPDSMIQFQHQAPRNGRLDFLVGNITGYSWQLTDPASNFPFGDAVRSLHTKWKEKILARNEHFTGFRSRFERFTQTPHPEPNEDIVSFGILIPTLAATSAVILLFQLIRLRRTGLANIACIATALCLFFVAFGALESWTPAKYRYFVLVGPFLAILAVHCLRGAGAVRSAALIAVGTLQLSNASYYGYSSHVHGWATVLRPQRCPYTAALERPTRITAMLGSQPARIAICVRFDAFTAQFLRTPVPHTVQFLPASTIRACTTNREVLQQLGVDYLIVSSEYLKPDREGVVVSSPWGVSGPYSIVRTATEAEVQARSIHPIQGLYPDGWTAEQFQILVQNWGTDHAVLQFRNPTEYRRLLNLSTSVHSQHFDLGPRQVLVVQLPIAADDMISGRVAPSFIPAEVSDSVDTRILGLMLKLPEP